MDADISLLRMVAISLSNFGICPMFVNSSKIHLTCTGSFPWYSSSAIVQSRLKSCVYMIDTKKLRESSVSEIMTNNAIFLLPMSPKSSSSYAVISLTSLMSNGASLAPQETRILLAVLPETKCQRLFSTHTFHCMKKATVDFSTMAIKSFLFTFDFRQPHAQTGIGLTF